MTWTRSAARSKKRPASLSLRSTPKDLKGTKKDGYKAACDALFSLIERNNAPRVTIPDSINILGEFNIGGETWMIKKYYEAMGVKVVSVITGDGRVDEVMQARNAALNVVQCSGSVTHLAKQMQEEYGIPFIRVSYFGIEDTSTLCTGGGIF